MAFQIFIYAVFALYGIALTLIFLYSLGQLHLVLTFWRNRKRYSPKPPLSDQDELPFVTIQLPIYNELYVVERLLDCVAAMDYPKDRFEIQLLDDSTDETVDLAAKVVARHRANGVDMQHIRRPDRVGFKAGALAYGMTVAKGEFIAIFDADFLPRPDFLRVALAHFTQPEIGVVQSRWQHLNQHYSIFTEAQAFHLDAHFTIEQFSRSNSGYYLNFNGTAGIWRKVCIEDAGGWEADTLTEDLDLSYRAQIKGWKFEYVDDLGSPAELPAEMGAIKSQQYRWMKGGAEVASKMLRNVWRSNAPFDRKLHGTLHLLSSSVFLLVFVLGITSVPLLFLKHSYFEGKVDFLILPVAALMCSFVSLGLLYLSTFAHREDNLKQALKRFFLYYIPFLSLSMGLSLHNSVAVLQGYWGKKTPFIRTPKYNLQQKGDKWQHVKYKTRKVKPAVYLELALAIYFLAGIVMAIHYRDSAILPFMIMQMFGFGAVGIFSFRHAWKK
ncbi:glycosyltransferase family 2 protein [Pontibacter sp. G13]|uniref:cellulose synthase family protein n=1 Tax=Pontibacter sp. G13 TaxID=3074898 RepID=UPI0028894543|nr:glycosyltransferase family 2 protein [Pontibacter sp. G13]WNJ16218.1 glycosyltransferase family 2 protein [Pontibacter sp. G13]